MSQIYSALAYYWDHKAELDTDIERRLEQVKQLKDNAAFFSIGRKIKITRPTTMSLSFYMDEHVHRAITSGLRLRGV